MVVMAPTRELIPLAAPSRSGGGGGIGLRPPPSSPAAGGGGGGGRRPMLGFPFVRRRARSPSRQISLPAKACPYPTRLQAVYCPPLLPILPHHHLPPPPPQPQPLHQHPLIFPPPGLNGPPPPPSHQLAKEIYDYVLYCMSLHIPLRPPPGGPRNPRNPRSNQN